MLSEWLDLTLASDRSAPPSAGTLRGARYRVLGCGILELTPEHRGSNARSAVISAGIHGNETAPIELIGELLAALEAGQLTLGAPLLIILGNIPAIRAQTRFVTTNLNRLFQREMELEGEEPDRARELMRAVDAFFSRHVNARLHLDLHTAIRDSRYPRFAVVPFTESQPPSRWPELAGAGMQAVLLQHRHSWTFSHYSRHYHGAEAYTLELGKVHPFGENDLDALADMRTWLAALAEGQAPETRDPASVPYFQVAHELMRHRTDFQLNFADDVANFTAFPTGTRLAEDAEAGPFIVEEAPLAVVFPNAHVELGARAALLVR